MTSILDKYFTGESKISSSELKKKLFKFGFKEKKCERCRIETWLDYQAPLELHHINGNSKDNRLENLQILCANCHSFTSNFRASNQRRVVIKKSIEEIIEAIKDSYNVRNCLLKLGYCAKGANYDRINSIMEKYRVSFREPTEEEIEKSKESKAASGKKRWDQLRYSAAKEGRIYIPKTKAKFASKEEAWMSSRKVTRPSKTELLSMVWRESVSVIAKRLGISDNAIRKWAKQYQIPVPPVGYWAKFNNNYLDQCNLIKDDLFKAFNISMDGGI